MYLRTDEEAEASDALCMVSRVADHLERDPRQWRWAIIALHNAVQGFMVLSLRHGNGLAALSEESFAKWMEAYEKEQEPPQEKLDSYLNLYKKVKSSEHGEIGGNKRFRPKGSQGKSIKKLNALRNDFIHFTPKGWSLEIDGLPGICTDCLALIEFLGWRTENIFWHDLDQKEKAELCTAKLRKQMSDLQSLYGEIS